MIFAKSFIISHLPLRFQQSYLRSVLWSCDPVAYFFDKVPLLWYFSYFISCLQTVSPPNPIPERKDHSILISEFLEFSSKPDTKWVFNEYLLNECLRSGFLEAEPETEMLLQWLTEGELSGETKSKWKKQDRKPGRNQANMSSAEDFLSWSQGARECEGHRRVIPWDKRIILRYLISFPYELRDSWEKGEGIKSQAFPSRWLRLPSKSLEKG